MNRKKLSLAVHAAIVGASIMVYSPTIMAQQAEAEVARPTADTTDSEVSKKGQAVEKITVTGSRLKRDSFSVTTPLVTMDKAAIADTGMGSLQEILVENMPGLEASISNTTSQSSVSSTGLSTISLRGLGSDRTLTLIDGRRVVSNSYSGNVVSLSTIPSGMVNRVEVISGGASATYGADAVAGVVNIITQTDKEGLGFKARTGETSDGGGKELTLDLDYGTSFDNGRGYLFFSSTYDREFGLSFYDRKRAQIEAAYSYDPDKMCNQMLTATGSQCMRDITQADWVSKSDGTLGGVFLEASGNDTQFWYDGQTLRDDWKGNEEIYGVNSNQWVELKVPNDNLSGALKLDYELTDDIKAYAQVQYSRNETINMKSPEDEYESAYVPIFDEVTGEPLPDVRPGYIPLDNPFVPQEILDANPYKGRIYWDRRFGEVGQIYTDNLRQTIRSWAGLQGTVFNGEWDWDISVGYGKFNQLQKRFNELNTVNVANALQAERLADGTIQCKSADARAEGCVPLNLFGEGSITPEAADYIRTNPTLETDITQLNVVAYMTGDLYALPAGMISAVFGAEYRKDTQDLITSRDMQIGGITWNVVPQFYGEVSVKEAFAEFGIPLLKNAPLAKSLTAETSLRIANYSMENVDTVSSYKLGLMWEPVEGYAVRTNLARAQRAPTISELMSPPRGDFDSFDDICHGVSATSTAAGHDNCRLEPAIAAQIAADPNFVFDDENNSYSPNTGNPNLFEETANTFTLGITMQPQFIEGFRLALDYYDIKVDDAIAEIGNQAILSECYNSSASWGSSNSFCNDITRNSEGQITKILQREFNLDSFNVRGVDLATEYNHDLGELGTLKFKADYTYVIESSSTYQGNDGLETQDYAGYGSPRDKASASLSWLNDGWRVRWSTKFLGGFTDSQSREEEYQQYVVENNERCSQGSDDCVQNPEPLYFQEFGSYIRHDLALSYQMKDVAGGDIRMFAGINNLFDNKGAFYPDGRGNFYSLYGGGTGRFFYLGSEFKF